MIYAGKTKSIRELRLLLIRAALQQLWHALTYRVRDIKLSEYDSDDLRGLPDVTEVYSTGGFDFNDYWKTLPRTNTSGTIKAEVVCADGFKMSVQASEFHYCEPRVTGADYYEQFEVGYPSDAERLLFNYSDDRESPASSDVFAYVPVMVIEAIIAKHGGVTWQA